MWPSSADVVGIGRRQAGNNLGMSERARGVAAMGLVGLAAALVVSAARVGNASSGLAPFVVATALVVAAIAVAFPSLRRIGRVRREARRGLRQIEVVLKLEASLATRRVPVAGSAGQCPNCGAPAGPHCVCRKR